LLNSSVLWNHAGRKKLDNILLRTDSYKVSHYRQYPPGSQTVYSYFESRGGRFHDVVFFGLQVLLKKYLTGQVVTRDKIEEAAEVCFAHFGDETMFNRAGWEYILNQHGGRLPLSIMTPPEGTVVPQHNAMMTVMNTDGNMPTPAYWLPNYLETLLVQTWYPCTVATQSREMKHLLLKYLRQTGDPCLVDFKLVDFGFRGVSSVETAGMGGAGHLVNFKSTDTLEGVMYARRYYGEPMAGFSIPAAEHSTITSWGQDNEGDACKNMLTQYPEGLVAVVSDSYNIFEACRDIWGGILRDQVLNRNGTLVIRPDSGDPPKIICEILPILWDRFGGTTNDKGYKVLDDHVRIIQGDGIDFEMLDQILYAMKRENWSADNIAFGSGGGLLQKLNRDTLKFAFKCSAIQVNGEWRDVFKNPITDHGKKSKRGRFKLLCEESPHGKNWRTVPHTHEGDDQLVEVFRDGEITFENTFADVRQRAEPTIRL